MFCTTFSFADVLSSDLWRNDEKLGSENSLYSMLTLL
jgi:hypothetical protein